VTLAARVLRASVCLTASAQVSACKREALPPADHGSGAAAVTTSIKVDHFGYRPGDPKVAIFSADPGAAVQVRGAGDGVVFTVPAKGGSIVRKGTDSSSGDPVWWVDFSPVDAPGRYHLFSAALNARSYEFVIAPNVYDEVLRAALKTFYFQRCGIAKDRRHAGAWADEAACHRQDASAAAAAGQVDRGRRDLAGGWHDAGDYNKYLWYAASNAVLFLLRAWEEDPSAFPDGGLDIPESGNGVSDLLDEVKWELDFFLKMQLPDGAVLSELRADTDASGAAPPSRDTTVRRYHDPTLQSGAVFAGSCARAARAFGEAGQTAYAERLRRAALSTWTWLLGQGDSDEKVWAAAEVFRMDPAAVRAREYVDGYHPASWSGVSFDLNVKSYDAQAALAYVEAPSATPAVAAAMRASIARAVDEIFAADDLYRNGMPAASYHWGSNATRAGRGVFLLEAARRGATGSHTADDCRRHALDLLHFFHGQNPLSMVYLTNMASRGGEHSSWQIFHHWFGQSQSPYSRAKYVGKPPSVLEPHYPYFSGSDNHGVRDDKLSAFGPAPGFVPGGPNTSYSGDAAPPRGERWPNRSYRDWNDQAVWTSRTWEITESSIGYQAPYVALVAAFVANSNRVHRLP
jgi:endoglucanase